MTINYLVFFIMNNSHNLFKREQINKFFVRHCQNLRIFSCVDGF
jgi:hypothetical protein